MCGAIATGLLTAGSALANFPGGNAGSPSSTFPGPWAEPGHFHDESEGPAPGRAHQGPADDAFPNYSPMASGSSSPAAYRSAGVGRVWIMNQDGSGQRQLTHGSPTV